MPSFKHFFLIKSLTAKSRSNTGKPRSRFSCRTTNFRWSLRNCASWLQVWSFSCSWWSKFRSSPSVTGWYLQEENKRNWTYFLKTKKKDEAQVLTYYFRTLLVFFRPQNRWILLFLHFACAFLRVAVHHNLLLLQTHYSKYIKTKYGFFMIFVLN